MKEKLECLKLALEYTVEWNKHNGSRYKTTEGVVEIAKRFYNFIKDEQ